jgi:DNA-binding NarL/FixJ family response regulator
MPSRIAIVEDDAPTRANLERLIRSTPGFECVGAYSSGEAAIAGLNRRPAEVVLMDINLPGMSGVECTRQLKSDLPRVEIVMLTVYDDSDRIFHALQMGAAGYLLKRASTDEIVEAIQSVLRGGAPMSSYIARKVVHSFRQPGMAKSSEGLSKRETEVLAYVARGYSNKEIADALGLSVETVRAYLKTTYTKLHVHSRTEAAMKFRP